MDRVHAEETLRQKTKTVVLDTLRETTPGSHSRPARKHSKIRKLAVGIAAAAACMMVAVVGYAYYETPVDYVSLDINPSVELGVNAFQKVVRAQGVGQDGTALMENLNLNNMSVEDAVRILVNQACAQGYVAPDGSSVIALTAQSASEEQAAKLGDQSRQGAQTALKAQNAVALLYGDTADLAIRNAAQQMDVSTGKYKLMMALAAMDPSLEIGQFKNATVSQIMLQASKMQGGAEQAGEFANTIQKMQQTADQIQQRAGIMQQAEDQDRIQTQEQAEKQDRIQTQEQAKDGTQTQDMQKDQTQSQDMQKDQTQSQDMQKDQTQSQDGPQESCEPTGYAEKNSNEGEGESREQEQNESTPSPTASPSGSGTAQSGQPAGQSAGDSSGAGGGNGKS
jgi:hypothetical protein